MTQLQTNTVYPVTVQNLPAYRVKLFDSYPSLKHTIFTRRGGVSRVPFHSLNLSISVGDDPHAVRHNAAAACRTLQTTPEQTVSCHLVHGADVLTIDQSNRRQVMGQADGLVTKEPGIYLFMRFGDCAPLLFYDPVENAVGLSHAGWRGTVKNAAGATVAAMQRLGCRPQNIIAVIGPSIGPCCYEVGPDVMAAVAGSFVDTAGLFERRNGSRERAYFDMWAANRRQLVEAGVGQVIQSGLCTACRTDEFFSHRAEQGQTGRFGVMMGIGENGRNG